MRSVERAPTEEQWAVLCFLAGRGVEIEADVLNAAVRRAELLLAAGGDPHRPLELFGRGVASLAADLDDASRRAALARGLSALEPELAGLRGAAEALCVLRGDPELAWHVFALGQLAAARAEDDSR